MVRFRLRCGFGCEWQRHFCCFNNFNRRIRDFKCSRGRRNEVGCLDRGGRRSAGCGHLRSRWTWCGGSARSSRSCRFHSDDEFGSLGMVVDLRATGVFPFVTFLYGINEKFLPHTLEEENLVNSVIPEAFSISFPNWRLEIIVTIDQSAIDFKLAAHLGPVFDSVNLRKAFFGLDGGHHFYHKNHEKASKNF